ncbi:DUF4367 domain-containing protein [Paenibacillus solisilvae]|uniref:DUF4367 domain-containing protein n=1 Tax=Paenibacillus solisilvae TaxID=2486751 RepID=A0ABW0VUW7_9BACL
MRRRISFILVLLLCATAVLAGCGTKDAESVVKDLDKVVNNMGSYHGKGKMTLHTGAQPVEYQVDVSYQKPQYYRIELTNAKKDITQIVLRNDEGVFVLTPRLNKVFRFQSDWPANQGQVYLYQTLISSILLDSSRQFAVDNDDYVFDVMANYQNGSLARQKIWLNKSDYAPRRVEVSDANNAVMVEVNFDNFEFDSKLDKSVFDTQQNMGSNSSNQPTMATPDDNSDFSDNTSNNEANNESATTPEEDNSNQADSNQADSNQADSNQTDSNQTDSNQSGNNAESTSGSNNNAAGEDSEDTMGAVDGQQAAQPSDAAEFTVMEPSYFPDGVSEKDQQSIVFGGNAGYMIRYTGDYEYSLIETQPKDVAASQMKGMIVDLGFTIGSISGEEQKTLTWTYNGIEYRLTSGTLPETEMTKVAQSVQGEMTK